MESIHIGDKVDAAAAIDHDVVARLKRALSAAGIADEAHSKVISACMAEALIPHVHTGGSLHASAAAGAGDKQTRLAKLTAAATSSEPAIQSTVAALSGLLRRSGISLADVVVDDVAALDRVLASATKPMSVDNRMVAKSLLVRLGIL